MADYLGKLPAFSCKVESVLEITSKEQNNKRRHEDDRAARAAESLGDDRG